LLLSGNRKGLPVLRGILLSEEKMPKMKTHRGAAKRFKLTGTGKVKRNKGYKSHLLTGKPAKRTRSLRQSVVVAKTDEKNIKTLLPYG
jgi:large subunit ribosomal protein L35